MRALVTGGTGFIGNRLVLKLLSRGWNVVCLVRRDVEPALVNVCPLRMDLNGLDTEQLLDRVTQPVDVIFHVGAALPTPQTRVPSYLASNAVATAALLEAAENWKVRSFVYTSTLLVIGKPRQTPISRTHPAGPTHPYALGKLCGEQICEFFRMTGRVPTTSLRLTSVFGIGMANATVLSKFSARAIQSEDLFYDGTGQRMQNFVYVDDVVQACTLAADRPGCGILNAGGGESVGMKELAELVVQLAQGSRSTVKPSGKIDPQEEYRWVPDIAETEASIGYRPAMTLAAAISEYMSALRQPSPVERWWHER